MKTVMKMQVAAMTLAGLMGGSVLGADAEKTPEGYVSLSSILEGIEAGKEIPAESQIGTDEGKISAFQKASTFMGMEVKNGENEIVGKVADMVFDPESGKIGYLLLAVENGEGARKVAVPLSGVKPAQGAEHLSLNMSEPLLAAAPGVDEKDLPPMDAFQLGDRQEAIGGPASAEEGSGRSESSLPKRTPRVSASSETPKEPKPIQGGAASPKD